jgi:hypothetical protein
MTLFVINVGVRQAAIMHDGLLTVCGESKNGEGIAFYDVKPGWELVIGAPSMISGYSLFEFMNYYHSGLISINRFSKSDLLRAVAATEQVEKTKLLDNALMDVTFEDDIFTITITTAS